MSTQLKGVPRNLVRLFATSGVDETTAGGAGTGRFGVSHAAEGWSHVAQDWCGGDQPVTAGKTWHVESIL